jgi:hypothetical protein
MWRCSYCGRVNAGLNSCDGCGAPFEGKSEPEVVWQIGTGALPAEPVKTGYLEKIPPLKKIRY